MASNQVVIKLLLPSALALWASIFALKAQENVAQRDILELGAYSNFFESASNFSLSFIRFSPRGFDARLSEVRLNGVLLNDLQSGVPQWSALGSSFSAAERRVEGFGIPFSIDRVGIGTIAGGEWVDIEPLDQKVGGKVSTSVSNRTYSYKVQGGYNLHTKNGWGVMVDVSRRWGRSMTTSGVWSDNWSGLLAFEKRLPRGHSLRASFVVEPGERAYAAPATDEAFSLAGNNLYNPSWGLWGDKERSVRTRKNFEPMAIVNHKWQINSGLRLENALYVRAGISSRSAMMWQNTPNPLPDYWAAMPSAQKSTEQTDLVAQMWREDIDTRQINFKNLTATNALNSPRSKYMIEDRVRDLVQASVQSSVFGPNFAAGANLTIVNSHNYKQMNDLMGGEYWLDVDNFVEMDEDVKELTQNNLRNPDAHIKDGDLFGYNYALNTFAATAWGAYRVGVGRWNFDVGVDMRAKVDQRVGYFEKENFPSGRSFGASEAIVTLDYTAKAVAGYRIGSRLAIDLGVAFTSRHKPSDEMFLSINYRNEHNPAIDPSLIFSTDLSARYVDPMVKAVASVFFASNSAGSDLHNTYDDLRHTYVHYSMRGISTMAYGLYGSVEVALPANFSVALAFALQNSVYTSDPVATEFGESTGSVVAADQVVFYDGLNTGLVPQASGVLEVAYRPFGWVVSLSGVASTGSYVMLSPLRRTFDAMSAAASQQALADMQNQEMMPAVFTLNFFGGRSWYFSGSNRSLGLYAGVNNLINNTSIKSAGYESSRLRNRGNSYKPLLEPHASKYYYALGANFFVSLAFRF